LRKTGRHALDGGGGALGGEGAEAILGHVDRAGRWRGRVLQGGRRRLLLRALGAARFALEVHDRRSPGYSRRCRRGDSGEGQGGRRWCGRTLLEEAKVIVIGSDESALRVKQLCLESRDFGQRSGGVGLRWARLWPLRLESVLLLKASVAPVSRVAIDGGRGIDGLMLRMAIRRKIKTLVKI
jgi:hypothetical protein